MPWNLWAFDKNNLSIDDLRPYLVRQSSNLLILSEGIPKAIYMWQRYPILTRQLLDAKSMITTQSNLVEIKTIILTNERIIKDIDSNLFKIHRKKENNIRLAINLSGAFSFGLGCLLLGLGVPDDLTILMWPGGVLAGVGALIIGVGNFGLSIKYRLSFAKIAKEAL